MLDYKNSSTTTKSKHVNGDKNHQQMNLENHWKELEEKKMEYSKSKDQVQ